MTLTNKTYNIIFWGACFILMLPIILLPPSFQPSVWTRTILFRILVTLLTGFLSYKYFYKKESVSLPVWNFKKYLSVLTFFGFFLLVVVSTIFSQDLRFSFFGSPARAGGTLNLFFYFIFSLILAFFLKEENWKKLWKVNFVIALIAGLFAIVQSFNIFGQLFVSYEGGTAPSFLGNSTFLAIYMLFMAIWSFVLFLQSKIRKHQFIYGGLFLLFILVIFLTGSRASYLGLVIASFFFLFFFPIKIRRIKILKIIAASLVGIAIVAVIIFNAFPQLAEKGDLFSRMGNRLSIERVAEDLFGTRFAVWQITLEAIKDKPILGWGPENFYIGFEKYYEPTAPNMQKLWWDRPHNIFLDIAVNFGIIALIFYIGFWIILLWQLQKIKQSEKNADNTNTLLEAHGLQAMFVAYLIALFFNFDSFPTYLISFFFIGYSYYLFFSKKETIEIQNQQKYINYKTKKSIFLVFAIILLLFFYFWNIKPLWQNETIAYAKSISNVGRCQKSLEIMENVNKSPGILKVYSALIYSDVIKKCANKENQFEYAEKGKKTLEKASVVQPYYTRTWLFMGGLTNVLAANEQDANTQKSLLQEARQYLDKALEISPKRQEIYVEIEKNYLVAQDYQSMKKSAYECINIDPTQGICYWYLGISEIFMGEQEKGKSTIEKALEIGGFPIHWLQLGAAHISQKNYKDAAEAYYMLTAGHPENAGYHAVYAFLLREIGEYGKAASAALRVFQLEPENEETQVFLEALLGIEPNDPIIHSSLAHLYKQLGEETKFMQELNTAKSIYLKLTTQNPNNYTLHYQLAGVYAELGEFENSYQQAILAMNLAEHPNNKKQIEDFIHFRLPKEFFTKYLKMINPPPNKS